MRQIILMCVVSALALTACKKELPRDRPSPNISLGQGVDIDYPHPGMPDILNLRNCPITSEYDLVNCRSIGTKGPIKKISWNDVHLKVAEAAISFDRNGLITQVCRQGFVGGGWNCASGPFPVQPVESHLEVDNRGRMIKREHSSFGGGASDSCAYSDDTSPSTSECSDGENVYTYRFDKSGRTISFSERRIPRPEESNERAQELDAAYSVDLTYSYRNDKFGNWIEFDVKDQNGRILVTRHRDLDYYQ